MKISFDLDERGGTEESGKRKFISRLRTKFIPDFCEEVAADAPSDVHIFVNKPNVKAKINIFRIDGIWINSDLKGWKDRNKAILNKMKMAQGAIYQNEFCKQATETILEYNHPNSVCILNGASAEEFQVDPIKRDRPYFLAACKWRLHKRLKATIVGFLDAAIPDVDLVVLGEPDCGIQHKQVVYKGWKDRDAIASYLAGCIGTVHLCYLDWCPNSVVESIVAGKQVIHTTSGGTPCVVKHRGYRITEPTWNIQPCKLYSPPKLDLSQVANAYRKSWSHPIKNFDIQDVDIATVADQYMAFIRQTEVRFG